MEVGTVMGGLSQEEHDGLIAALKKEGWQLRLLSVEIRDGLVTGVVNLKIVQKKVYEDYLKIYHPLEDKEYENKFCASIKSKKK
jgi:hypothetical protein